MDLFGLDTSDLRKAVDLALASGGAFAEIFLEHRTYDFVNMEEDIIRETAESVSLGLGIRVLSGDKTGYGYTNDLALDKVQKAARTASAIASGKVKAHPAPPIREKRLTKNAYRVSAPAEKTGLRKKIALVREAYGAAQRYDPRVVKVMDLKTPGSGEMQRNLYSNLTHLTARDQVKFVIADEADYEWSKQQLIEYRLQERCQVLFSPVMGAMPAANLADRILADQLPVRFQIQLHKYLWDDARGK